MQIADLQRNQASVRVLGDAFDFCVQRIGDQCHGGQVILWQRVLRRPTFSNGLAQSGWYFFGFSELARGGEQRSVTASSWRK